MDIDIDELCEISDLEHMFTITAPDTEDEAVVAREDVVNIPLPPWAIRAGARRCGLSGARG